MSKALVVIKSMGIGDLVILIANIHAISKSINKSVVVLAPKNTHATSILKHDPHVKKVLELDKKGFFNTIKKIKLENFDQSYIYSDSLRLCLISKFSGIKKNFQYDLFSKKGKNFYKTAKIFTENILNIDIDSHPKIFCKKDEILKARNKFNISNKTKNIICGISASGPTKRWDIKNYIKLFENINSRFPSKFFLAGGLKDQDLIDEVMDSSIGESCVSFSKMSIEETLPIISACDFCISNDTGFAHISSALGLKCLVLFMDSPPSAYGTYSKNISIIVPEKETIESCGHNTRGKDNISFKGVLDKIFYLLN
jgi:ADP-heptose:LPS heptosyltransferase